MVRQCPCSSLQCWKGACHERHASCAVSLASWLCVASWVRPGSRSSAVLTSCTSSWLAPRHGFGAGTLATRRTRCPQIGVLTETLLTLSATVLWRRTQFLAAAGIVEAGTAHFSQKLDSAPYLYNCC